MTTGIRVVTESNEDSVQPLMRFRAILVQRQRRFEFTPCGGQIAAFEKGDAEIDVRGGFVAVPLERFTICRERSRSMSAAGKEVSQIVESAEMMWLDIQNREVGVSGRDVAAGGFDLLGLEEQRFRIIVGHGSRIPEPPWRSLDLAGDEDGRALRTGVDGMTERWLRGKNLLG